MEGLKKAIAEQKALLDGGDAVDGMLNLEGVESRIKSLYELLGKVEEVDREIVERNKEWDKAEAKHQKQAALLGAEIHGQKDKLRVLQEQEFERLGGMDVYFHVAGVGSQNPQLDPTVELHTVRTNVEGFTRMTTAAYGYFAAHGGGRIAVVSSIAGTRGLGVAAAYSASKRFQNTYRDQMDVKKYNDYVNKTF